MVYKKFVIKIVPKEEIHETNFSAE